MAWLDSVPQAGPSCTSLEKLPPPPPLLLREIGSFWTQSLHPADRLALGWGGTGAGLATAPPTQTTLGEVFVWTAAHRTRQANVWSRSVVPEDYMLKEDFLYTTATF